MSSSQNGNKFPYADTDATGRSKPQLGVTSPPAFPTTVTKKHRRLRACDSCRQRKIRCDNNPAACRNCEVYHTVCLITLPNGSVVSRGSGVLSQSNSPVSRKSLKRNASIAHQLPFVKAGATIESDKFERHGFARKESQEQDGYAAFASPPNASVTSMRSDALEGVTFIEPGRFPQKNKFAGMSSGQVLAKSAEELFKDNVMGVDVMKFFCPLMDLAEETPLSPLFLQPLVNKNTADGQIDVFFSTIHVLFPVFDEMDFRQKYQSFYSEGLTTNAGTAACIYMAIALGGDNSPSSKELQAVHFQATWSLFDRLIACPYLPSVQALILLTLELMSARRDGQAILIIGSAIRIAQSLGLHRKLAVRIHPHEKEFLGQNHYRRSCIWWVCYCLDKKLCLEGGRPSIINDDDCDADLPELATGPGSPSQGGQPIDGGAFLGNLITLCRVLSRISSQLFGRAVSRNSEVAILQQVEATDQALLQFKSSLPVELQPDQDFTGFGVTSNLVGPNLLHCIYHNAMITIHRAALLGSVSLEMTKHSNPRIVKSESICLGAARSLARSVNELVHSSAAWLIPRLTLSYALNTVFTLYIGIMKSPQRWSCDSDLALMRSMRGCLLKMELQPQTMHDFDLLLASLCRAVETAQQRTNLPDSGASLTSNGLSRDSNLPLGNLPGCAQQGSEDISGLSSRNDGQGGSGDFDLRFVDFFGNDVGHLDFQLWPIGIDTCEEARLPSGYGSTAQGGLSGQAQSNIDDV